MTAASKLPCLTSSFSSGLVYRLIAPSLLLPSPLHCRANLFLPVPHPLAPRAQLPILRTFTTSSIAEFGPDVPPLNTKEPPSSSHPWPEWERFIDKLSANGYFEPSTSVVPSGDVDGSVAYGPAEMGVNRVKNACLKFARERFDSFREDILAVVEHGCPNIFRKAVSSAKRLRAYLHLDEGAVCSVCDLRGSCDKAYIIPVDGEGPRTVDVVRILLSYALNPKQFCVSDSSHVKEHMQKSSRSLLFEPIKLSDTPIDLSITKPVVKLPTPNETFPKLDGNQNRASNIEMKRGDWLCPNCNFLNFAQNLRCLECKEDGPERVNRDSSNEMKKGDWNCPKCDFMNFARNKKCFRCEEQRPKRELNNGEWECPSCYYLNFRRNELCKRCNHDRPEDEGYLFDDNLWRSQMKTTEDTIKFGDDDDGILPLVEESNIGVRRATTAQRRLTSSRN
ncbi:zinc finger protein VAR3, chloroplastic-like isoform X2 [Zingiber officinale]|uniref:zinc finger protein VAR3, chloroplastic-like isoform X2 n=1 Tax=Zingiber officinale TaxID=94328 RepID=UPI001C4CFB95|nr:zinc finger protein VAR3, chloroplastic-like isoform X2 [Zingiber officinale]